MKEKEECSVWRAANLAIEKLSSKVTLNCGIVTVTVEKYKARREGEIFDSVQIQLEQDELGRWEIVGGEIVYRYKFVGPDGEVVKEYSEDLGEPIKL